MKFIRLSIYLFLYGCENLVSYKSRVFENRVLSKMFGPRRDDAIGGCRKLRNEQFHNLCFLPDIVTTIKSRKVKRAGPVVRMGTMRNVYTFFLGKS